MHIADFGAGRMEDQAATPLPKCFCNWKNCRTYQKALREYKHPIFNGVVKLKFTKNDRKSMALKSSVDRTLHVDATKRNDWKPMEQNELTCRYYVARHHFTEALMKQYMSDRRGWDWNEPLTMKQAKTLLWILDRQDVYLSEGEEEGDDDTRYVQSPNVPKDQVRELLKKVKDDYKLAQAPPPPAVSPVPVTAPKKGNSVHTQSTLSTTVTDTLKAFEDIIGHQELATKDVVLAQKEEENMRLRQELNECQEQLTKLHTMVKQLKVDMDKSRDPEETDKRKKTKPPQQPKKKKVESSSDEEESEEDEESSEGDGEEEEEDDDDEEEDGDWSHGRLQGRHTASDDDETISTFHVNGAGGSANGAGSNHSRRIRSKTGSIHSRRSVRRDSVHSRRNSIHSRSRHSVRRDSIHSRRSMRGGMDDAASVVSRQSLQSVSPSIKSLPREIELMDDDEEEEEDPHAKDDYSFFDDSYRKPDDDARSVGSRSAASRASRRSMVSGARSRGRNSRRPGQSQQQQAPAKPPKGTRGSAVPREIDLSGDELEDETYANVSTDTLFVTDKQIVDPYGEKGVYTGALSKSTGMPNGKGRLEYEKEGRWYEGDWIHGRWTGYGRLSNGDGDFYEGGLKNDHKHGTGVMRFADGRVFEGEYIRGQMIQGKMTYQDGSVYGGSWVDGMRHGRGKCIFVDGSEYEGEFREGNFHGHGQMTWNDGGWYVGEWSDGEMHGRGKEIRPDGSLRHDGEWSRGQPIRSSNDSRRRRQQQQPPQGELAVK